MRNNNKALYEKIIQNISKELKKVLNEKHNISDENYINYVLDIINYVNNKFYDIEADLCVVEEDYAYNGDIIFTVNTIDTETSDLSIYDNSSLFIFFKLPYKCDSDEGEALEWLHRESAISGSIYDVEESEEDHTEFDFVNANFDDAEYVKYFIVKDIVGLKVLKNQLESAYFIYH